MKRISLIALMLCAVCCISVNGWAQTRTITGRVLGSDTGGPLSFASVAVKGSTTLGTYTDDNGRFSIPNVPATATHLIVGNVGYATVEMDISNRNSVEVTLQAEALALTEVVVTALGIQRQAKELGYATAKVGGDDLASARGSDASAALIGKVSGLQINMSGYGLDATARVNLRGSRSFRGNNQALLILDGVPSELDMLQRLNPNDIDNVSVLKGGSAAALYGSAAANGVIYVSTKKGDKGKPKVVYSFTTRLSDATAYLPKWQTRFGGGADNSTTSLPEYDPTENQQYGPEYTGLPIHIGAPLYDPNDPTGAGNQLMGIYSAKKNTRESFYNLGVEMQHNISYSSGDETGNVFFSYQRVDQTTQTPGDEGTRQNVRITAARKYGKFKLSGTMNYNNMHFNTTTNSSAGIYALMSMAVDRNLPDYKDWRNTEGGRPDEWVGSNYYNNPYFEVDMNRRNRKNDRFNGNLEASFQPLKWLTFIGRGSFNVNATITEDNVYAWNYNTTWATKVGRSFGRNKRYSTMEVTNNHRQQTNLDFMAQTEHKLLSDLTMNGLLGWSMSDRYASQRQQSATLALDDFFNLKNKTGEITGSNNREQVRTLSTYGSLRFGYKGWAFLEITGRNDWTSLLAPDNWSFFYPGVNASVVLSDAIPSIKNEYISHLKIRATAAKTGTVNMDPYNLYDLASPYSATGVAFPYGSLSSYYTSVNIRNPYIKPEFTTEFEIGAEIGFLKDRITLEAAVYQQTTNNQTVNVAIPYSAGYATMYLNAGEMRGRGFEVDLRVTPLLKLGDFRWNLTANFTMQESIVTDIYGGLEEFAYNSSYGNFFAKVGQPYPWFKASDWDRDPQGRVVVNANTGYPSTASGLIDAGTTVPKYILGLSSRFRWRDLELNVTADYRGGHIARFAQESDMLFQGTSYVSSLMGRQRFVFPNSVIREANGSYTENTSITTNSGGRNFWTSAYSSVAMSQVASAASWRIRELSLRYNLPRNLIERTGFLQAVSVSFVASNLALWTPNTNYWGDPDMYSTGSGNAPGYQSMGRSGTRTYGFDITVNF